MTIEELYKCQKVQKDSARIVSIPYYPDIKLPYEEILPEYEPINLQLDTLPDLDRIISEKSGTFQFKGSPVIIYERRHTNSKKRGEQGFYPYTYHMFYCSHLNRFIGTKEDVRQKCNATTRTDGLFEVFIGSDTKKTEMQHTLCWDCYNMLGNMVGTEKLRRYCGSRYDFSLDDFCLCVEKGLFPFVKELEDFDRFRVFRNKEVYYSEQYWSKYAYLRKVAAGFRCERCGKICKDENGKYIEKSLQVHHIDRNPLNMDPNDHIVLCVACHEREHGYKKFNDIE